MRLIDADRLRLCYTGSNGLDNKASYVSIRAEIDLQPTVIRGEVEEAEHCYQRISHDSGERNVMERLTKTYDDGTHAAADNLPCGENSWNYKELLLNKLGAYEDTGLSPCEILALLDKLKYASEQWDIWCDAYQKDAPVWIPVAERMPTENECRVVCAAHSGKPFLRRFEVAYITDTTEYQFGYYDGYKWIDKSNKEIPNVVAWKIHKPFNTQN